MICFFDSEEDTVANNIPPSERQLIAERWKVLLDKEQKLREFMKTHSVDEPFIGQWAYAWITSHNAEEWMGFFLKRLSEVSQDQDTFIFYYDEGYVAFSGHNSKTILSLMEKIENEMYANCMRTLVE